MNKRLDDADLSSLNIPDRYHSETWIGKNGKVADESNAFCKILITGKWEKYFIWTYRGDLFDPYYSGQILRKNDESLCRFKVVKKEVFNQYFNFLKTKNIVFLTRARRLHKESVNG